MDNVKRIEIVKGAASSLYGSNAVGGVVNIISRESQEPWSVNVNGRYGAHNEHAAEARHIERGLLVHGIGKLDARQFDLQQVPDIAGANP